MSDKKPIEVVRDSCSIASDGAQIEAAAQGSHRRHWCGRSYHYKTGLDKHKRQKHNRLDVHNKRKKNNVVLLF